MSCGGASRMADHEVANYQTYYMIADIETYIKEDL